MSFTKLFIEQIFLVLREFLYMTLKEVTHTVLSVQEIFFSIVFCSQAQTLKVALVVDLDSLKASLFQCKIEVSRAADILVAVHRVVAVCLIKCRGAFLIGIIHFTLGLQGSGQTSRSGCGTRQ